ncbi:LysR substrate-binding domain-containing protein [Cupriavidus basilensis]
MSSRLFAAVQARMPSGTVADRRGLQRRHRGAADSGQRRPCRGEPLSRGRPQQLSAFAGDATDAGGTARCDAAPRGARRGTDAPSIPLRQIGGLPLVLPVPPNAIRNLLEDMAGTQDITLNVCMEASSSVVIKRMVTDHAAFPVLPYHAITAELENGVFDAVPLTERALRQTVVLATSSQRPFTAAARQVAQMIPGIADALIQEGLWRR